MYDVFFPLFFVLFELLVYMANDLVMPGMLTIVLDLKSNPHMIPATLTAYLAGGSVLQLFIGPASDVWGRRRVMFCGILLFIVSSLFLATAQSMPVFLVERFFQGMGLCFINTIGYAVVQEFYDDTKALRVLAILSSTSLISPMLGPLVGAYLMSKISWRMIFLGLAFIPIVSLVGLWFFMPETAHFKYIQQKEKTFTKALRKEFIPSFKFKDFMVLFQTLLKNKIFMTGSLVQGLTISPLLCWIALSPLILTEKNKIEGVAFGLVQIPLFLFLIFGNIIMGWLAKRYSSPSLSLIGIFVSVTFLVLCVFTVFLFPNNLWAFLVPLCFYCIGVSIFAAPFNRMLIFSSETPRGTTSSLISLMNNLVLALSVSLCPFVYHSYSDKMLSFFNLGALLLGALCIFIFLGNCKKIFFTRKEKKV